MAHSFRGPGRKSLLQVISTKYVTYVKRRRTSECAMFLAEYLKSTIKPEHRI